MKTLKTLLKTAAISAATVISAGAMAGGSIDLSLSNDTVRMEYDAAKAGSGLHVSLTGQHHTERGSLLGLGVHVVDVREPNSPLYIGVGGKIFAYQASFKDGKRFDGEDTLYSGAVGIGGFLRYNIPQTEGLSVAGYGYFAPEVVSFNGTKNLFDMDFRVQYALIPTARVYLGYRLSRVNLTDEKNSNVDSIDLARGVHAGLKIDF